MKIVFMGTPEFSVPILEGLIENYDVIGVVTQPDKEVGRSHVIKFSKVKEVALANDIRVFQPVKVREDYDDIVKLNPDLIIAILIIVNNKSIIKLKVMFQIMIDKEYINLLFCKKA